MDKLEQSVKVTCLSVLLLLLPILEEDQCWVAMDTMMATEVPLHCTVHLEFFVLIFGRKGNVVVSQAQANTYNSVEYTTTTCHLQPRSHNSCH